MMDKRTIDEMHVEAQEFAQQIRDEFLRSLEGKRAQQEPPQPPPPPPQPTGA